MKMLKTKHFRRLAVFLAMLAPAVYLFGTSFSALTGAHGEKILEDTSYVTPSYDELMTPENFSYGAFDWTNEHGTRYGFSLGYYYAQNIEEDFNLYLGLLPHGVTTELYSAGNGDMSGFKNAGLGYAGNDDTTEVAIYFDLFNQGNNMAVEYPVSVQPYAAFYMIGNNHQDVLTFEIYKSGNNTQIDCYHNVNGTWFLLELDNTTLDEFDTQYNLYFDDGSHLPEGVEWNEDLRSYFVPTVKPVETTSYPVTLFGSFFPRDNFLVQWGSDAISETPHGFAPFGAFWRYLDTNVLHLSSEQIGLMGYGYMYYACHVLLFDVAFILVTFFLDFIQKVNDKVVGGVD